MTKEQIEKAAIKFAKSHYLDKYGNMNAEITEDEFDALVCSIAYMFMYGAQWRINSVWHDMEEEAPQVYGEYGDSIYSQIPCLVRGMLSTGYGYGVRYWNVTEQCWDDEECDDYECDKDKIEEWAYLDDLLPEREEETK